MSDTVRELIAETQQMLRGMSRTTRNRLTNARDADDTDFTLDFTFEQSIAADTFLVVDDEILYVWSVNSSSMTVVVERGAEGTTAAAHDAGATVYVNPRFARPSIRRALKEEIASWPRNVYRILQTQLAIPATGYAVDLGLAATDFIDVLEVRRVPTAGDPWRSVKFDLARDQTAADFASGHALFISELGLQGATVNVVYSAPFDLTTFDDTTNLVSTVGLSSRMTDIPPMGAAWRLLSGQEALRTAMEARGQHRPAEDVPAGATLRAAAGFKSFRDLRLQEEAGDLLARHGWRST